MKRHLITELTRGHRKRFNVISEKVYFGTWSCNLCIAKIKSFENKINLIIQNCPKNYIKRRSFLKFLIL